MARHHLTLGCKFIQEVADNGEWHTNRLSDLRIKTLTAFQKFQDFFHWFSDQTCQSAFHSFQFSAFGNSQRTAFNLAQHQHDWHKLMLIAGKNSALIDTQGAEPKVLEYANETFGRLAERIKQLAG